MPEPGGALEKHLSFDVTSDGRTVVMTWQVPFPNGDVRWGLVAIDVADRSRRTLATSEGQMVERRMAANPDRSTQPGQIPRSPLGRP